MNNSKIKNEKLDARSLREKGKHRVETNKKTTTKSSEFIH